MKSKLSTGGLVYSTEAGRMCPGCRQPVARCVCKQAAAVPVGDGVVRVSRETKGRGGKAVSLVKGLALDGDELVALAKQLKERHGIEFWSIGGGIGIIYKESLESGGVDWWENQPEAEHIKNLSKAAFGLLFLGNVVKNSW